MNQRTKLIIILGAVGFLLLLGLIYSFSKVNAPGSKGLTTPAATRAPLPEVSFKPYLNLQPQTYLAPKNLIVPAEAELYSLSGGASLTLAMAKDLGLRLGFTAEPQVSQTTNGQNYVFVNETDDRLSIKENPLTLSFFKNSDFSQAQAAPTLGQTAAQAKARDFLNALRFNFPAGVELRGYETYYLRSAGLYSQKVKSSEGANQIGVDFGLYLNGNRIFEETSPVSLASVTLGAQGEIAYAQLVLPFGLGILPASLKSEGRLNLENEKVIKEKIGRGEAVIKYLRQVSGRGDEEINQLPPTLALTSFEVGYLATTAGGKNYLYPIYVFKTAGQLAAGKEIEGLVFLKVGR